MRLQLLCLVIGLKISRHQFINQWEGKSKPIATCTRDFACAIFPALSTSYTELLRIWIGSLRCLHQLWLVEVITFVFVLRHSIESRSNHKHRIVLKIQLALVAIRLKARQWRTTAILTLQPHPVAQTHGAVVVNVTFALSTIFCRESNSFTVKK